MSRHQAQALSLAGKVTVNGHKVDKPGHSVAEDSLIEIDEGDKFVSRGGLKLEHALNSFSDDFLNWLLIFSISQVLFE